MAGPQQNWILPFLGGLLVGCAALMMLIFNGRIMGVSGILGGLFQVSPLQQKWRAFFLFGVFLGGWVLHSFLPDSLQNTLSRTPYHLILAGVLVGWGTRLGNGCTSGHGICGVSRLSPRSLVATATFMGFGILTVWVMKFWGLS